MNTELNEQLESVMFSYTSDNRYMENENRALKETVGQLQKELTKYRQPALMVCEVSDIIGDKAVVKIPNGNRFYVNIGAECEKLRSGDTVLCEQKNLNIICKINGNKRFNVERFIIIEKPQLPWECIGGLKSQIEELKEVIELPLMHPQLFEKVGITPPKGVLLHGPPGTGKTLLAKAVAASTKSTFIEIVGSELVQKFIGEGAKLVKEVFQLAREKAPSIVYIDELDAIAAKRIEVGTSGEREVQRTFMQLLAELDGFKALDNVKLIGCTNRKDILDPAILRPGRLDRLLEVPIPDKDGIREIFKIHTRCMTLNPDIKHEAIFKKMTGYAGAEVKAAITEAGYCAIRENRTEVRHVDFLWGIDKVNQKEKLDRGYLKMFG